MNIFFHIVLIQLNNDDVEHRHYNLRKLDRLGFFECVLARLRLIEGELLNCIFNHIIFLPLSA